MLLRLFAAARSPVAPPARLPYCRLRSRSHPCLRGRLRSCGGRRKVSTASDRVLNPIAFLFLFLFLGSSLPGFLGLAVRAASTNLGGVIFFSVSTWILWKRGEKATADKIYPV